MGDSAKPSLVERAKELMTAENPDPKAVTRLDRDLTTAIEMASDAVAKVANYVKGLSDEEYEELIAQVTENDKEYLDSFRNTSWVKQTNVFEVDDD